ncbi:MAG: macrocin-O-methyltransferase, partial [Oscillospiraceae bacterium]|nr:macrocin-O-methyltransferase [Oscillospiraceae bacterium]
QRIDVVAFLDNDKSLRGTFIGGIPVFAPERAAETDYDKIVVAHSVPEVRMQMLTQLTELGVPYSKIELEPGHWNSDTRIWFLRKFAEYAAGQGIKGAAAECGVYRGAFAKHINKEFPDSTLYLFDTFEGFAERDITAEAQLHNDGFIRGKFNQTGYYSDTSAEKVMQAMPYPGNVIIKKGWIPETFAGVDDSFCFVSLDTDLYQPMFEGLKFFWDKTVSGGVMLLHDYFNPLLPGVKQAVAEFEALFGSVPKTPIGDDFTIAIIKV